MSHDMIWRLLLERLSKGEATGILCEEEEVPSWIERLRREVPLLQRVGEKTLYFHTGAVVLFCTTPEEAHDWESKRPGPVVWIDEANQLEAPLPAPKPSND